MTDFSYTLRTVEVKRTHRLSPSFMRVTFTGDAVAHMASWGPDQRVKLYIPLAGSAAPQLPAQDWNGAWQGLPADQRPARRSYTIRYLRQAEGELDIDFALHGDEGPASAWALQAEPGSTLQIAAPNHAYSGAPIGFEWRPPATAQRVLIYGDETALPAIAGILESIVDQKLGFDLACFVEVAQAEDKSAAAPVSDQIIWLTRNTKTHRSPVFEALGETGFPELEPLSSRDHGRAVLGESERVWQPALGADDGDTNDAFYAWVAAEAHTVKTIRQALLETCGLDRRTTSLMGYWYKGRPFG